MIRVLAGVRHLKDVSALYNVENLYQEGTLEEDYYLKNLRYSKK